MRNLPIVVALVLTASGCTSGGGNEAPAIGLNDLLFMPELSDAEMPVTGTAEFSGMMTLARQSAPDDPSAFIGSEINLTTDFAEGDLTGTASNWRDEQTGPIAGEATIETGWVDGSEFGGKMRGELSGMLPNDGGPYSGTLDLDLSGHFVADSPAQGPDGVVGQATGSLVYDGGVEPPESFLGDILAVRSN